MAAAGGYRAARGRGVVGLAFALAAYEAAFLPLVRVVVAVDSPPVRVLIPAYGAGARKAKGADPGVIDAAPGRGRAGPQGVLQPGS